MIESGKKRKQRNWVVGYTVGILFLWSIYAVLAAMWEGKENHRKTIKLAHYQALAIYQTLNCGDHSSLLRTNSAPAPEASRQSHIVRLLCRDVANSQPTPDAWETRALDSLNEFNHVSSLETVDGHPYLRFVKALRPQVRPAGDSAKNEQTPEYCNTALSIMIPMEPLSNVSRCEILNMVSAYTILWSSGTLVVLFGHIYLRARRRSHLQYEEQLLEKIDQAKGENIRKDRFLSNMSHEIRTPMNSILGFTELLIEDKLTEQQKDYLRTVQNSGKGLLELINDILDLSKIESGKMKIVKKMVSLDGIINDVRALMAQTISCRGLTFKLLKTMGVPGQIYTDPLRLKQCLINLINNAIKFTESGSITLHAGMYVEKKQQWIRFDVQDTGIGIPPEKQKEIFREFVQADDTTAHKYGGTGLGLAITQQLTEMMGGKVTLQSQPGQGSTFSIHLPVQAPAASETPQPQQSGAAS